ncbi:MAG: hydantoinase/oxoprolinase family protein [Promethearchaeota archaeon]|nr:MAG: hydantoinase/oxoprolinase family protein [Candidatus Lokiarchaeota archaeon]
MSYRISVDVGGTFTDMMVINEKTGEVGVFKTLTTPQNLTEGVMNAIKLAASNYGKNISQLLEDTISIVHGTTATTNAIIEGKVGKVGVITTKGFRDILHAREGGKEQPFNWKIDYPTAFIPRYLILTVAERINSEGEIEEPLDENQVREIIKNFKEWEVDAIAICLLWSFANPIHENRISKIITEEWPEISYDCSHIVNPVIREYRRFIATVINSSLRKVIGLYISNLEKSLESNDFKGNLFLMTSTGGVLDSSEIITKPILTLGSGPSMLPVAALHVGLLEKESNDVIGVDMGGTSFDLAFVSDGEIHLTQDTKLNPSEIGGDKIGISIVDIESIGAGGGSIAWVDSAGYLHVGPQSAGANPGPACYGFKGKSPTVTDANVILGYINPEYFLGGKMKIFVEKAEEAIKIEVADKLNIGVVEAASRIYTTINYDMIISLRDLAIRRGIDPRERVLVGGGGAFGIHAAHIAKEIGVKEILIPKKAGVLSAYGGLISDIKHDFRATSFTTSNAFEFDKINKILEELEKKAEEFFIRANIIPENRQIKYYMEARYPYQVYDLNIPLTENRITEKNISKIIESFHEIHQKFYASSDPKSHIEATALRVSAIGKVKKPQIKEIVKTEENASIALKGTRNVYFREKERFIETSIYDGDKLKNGHIINGPAIVEEVNTTIVIPPNYILNVTKYGDYFLKVI